MTYNKAHLAENIRKQFDTTKQLANALADFVVQDIRSAVVRGDHVELKGFFTCHTQKAAPCTRRNPITGESVQVPEKTVVKMKVHRSLKLAVNEYTQRVIYRALGVVTEG